MPSRVRRTDPAPRGPAAIDRRLGTGARLLERHQVDTAAAPARAFEAALALPLSDLPLVRALFSLRGIPFRPSMTIRAFFSTPPFALLEEEEGRELVFGISRGGMTAVGNFRADPVFCGEVATTETWVETRGRRARAAFALYWLAIGRFSAWIRRMMLSAAARRAESGGGPDR